MILTEILSSINDVVSCFSLLIRTSGVSGEVLLPAFLFIMGLGALDQPFSGRVN